MMEQAKEQMALTAEMEAQAEGGAPPSDDFDTGDDPQDAKDDLGEEDAKPGAEEEDDAPELEMA